MRTDLAGWAALERDGGVPPGWTARTWVAWLEHLAGMAGCRPDLRERWTAWAAKLRPGLERIDEDAREAREREDLMRKGAGRIW